MALKNVYHIIFSKKKKTNTNHMNPIFSTVTSGKHSLKINSWGIFLALSPHCIQRSRSKSQNFFKFPQSFHLYKKAFKKLKVYDVNCFLSNSGYFGLTLRTMKTSLKYFTQDDIWYVFWKDHCGYMWSSAFDNHNETTQEGNDVVPVA